MDTHLANARSGCYRSRFRSAIPCQQRPESGSPSIGLVLVLLLFLTSSAAHSGANDFWQIEESDPVLISLFHMKPSEFQQSELSKMPLINPLARKTVWNPQCLVRHKQRDYCLRYLHESLPEAKIRALQSPVADAYVRTAANQRYPYNLRFTDDRNVGDVEYCQTAPAIMQELYEQIYDHKLLFSWDTTPNSMVRENSRESRQPLLRQTFESPHRKMGRLTEEVFLYCHGKISTQTVAVTKSATPDAKYEIWSAIDTRNPEIPYAALVPMGYQREARALTENQTAK